MNIGPEHLDEVLALCERRQYPPRPWRGQTAEERKRGSLESYRTAWRLVGHDPDLKGTIVPGKGFFLFGVGFHESITGEKQAQALDLWAEDSRTLKQLLDEAEAIARSHGELYLTVEIDQGDPLEEWMEEHGYRVDLNRIVVPTLRPQRLRNRVKVRPARPSDQLFILSLNANNNRFTIPEGRQVDPAQVEERYLDQYLSLQLGGSLKGWIAEDGGPVGYLLVRTGFQNMAYIYDLGVERRAWGKWVAHELIAVAATLLTETILAGDVSNSNLRALRPAQKDLGFSIEWRRWIRRIAP